MWCGGRRAPHNVPSCHHKIWFYYQTLNDLQIIYSTQKTLKEKHGNEELSQGCHAVTVKDSGKRGEEMSELFTSNHR